MGAEDLLDDPYIAQVAEAHSATPAQVTLRHALQLGAAVLAKSLTPTRIGDNADVYGDELQLSDAEVRSLCQLDKGKRSYWDNSMVQ